MDPIALLVFAAIIVEIMAIPSYARNLQRSMTEENVARLAEERRRTDRRR